MSLVLRRSLVCVLICCALLAGKETMAQTALPSLSDPAISPDGREIAFVSGGDIWTGAANIYVLTLATGELARLTYSDRPDALDGWSHDGKWIYFTSAVNDVAGQGDIFRVSSSGGTPLE